MQRFIFDFIYTMLKPDIDIFRRFLHIRRKCLSRCSHLCRNRILSLHLPAMYQFPNLLVILSRSGSFVLFSGRLVCAESHLKQGFFALEALLRLHFFKVGSNRHFCRFWREIGEDRREITREGNTKLHTPQKELQTDEIYF